MVVASGWGQGRGGSYCLMGTEFQFCKMKGALEMGGGGGLQNVDVLSATLPDERS